MNFDSLTTCQNTCGYCKKVYVDVLTVKSYQYLSVSFQCPSTNGIYFRWKLWLVLGHSEFHVWSRHRALTFANIKNIMFSREFGYRYHYKFSWHTLKKKKIFTSELFSVWHFSRNITLHKFWGLLYLLHILFKFVIPSNCM